MSARTACAPLAALLLAACMATVPMGGGGGNGALPGDGGAGEARRVADLVNARRARAGCVALIWDERAAAAAERHSADMAARRYFSHTSPEGGRVGDRLSAAGVAWRAVAENIGYGPVSADEMVRMWVSSAGHRENIDDCAYTHHGVGVRDGRWTHVFYAPRTW
jgi:uncharacterized protein YkwD